jgi:exodeoxyribonuclease V alpha subunit
MPSPAPPPPAIKDEMIGLQKILVELPWIGPASAERIILKWGFEVPRVLDRDIDALGAFLNFNIKKLSSVKKAWASIRGIEPLMTAFGRPPMNMQMHVAKKLAKAFGPKAMHVVRENPYDLIGKLPRVGFKIIDKMAQGMGLPADSQSRGVAAAAHCVRQLMDQHSAVFLCQQVVEDYAARVYGVPKATLAQGLDILAGEKKLIKATEPQSGQQVYYTPESLRMEKFVASRFMTFWMQGNMPKGVDEELLASVEEEAGATLSQEQREGVRAVMDAGIRQVSITGGPGTGKTYLMQVAARALDRASVSFAMATPTGMAARRLAEHTGYPASTLHRLAGIRGNGYQEKIREPLPYDVILIDEASMVSLEVMAALLNHLKQGVKLVLVGDKDQLPAIGMGGNLFRQIIDSGAGHTVRLRKVFRQAARSSIIRASHLIREGNFPKTWSDEPGMVRDYELENLAYKNPEQTAQEVVAKVVVDLMVNKAYQSVQVLTAGKKGPLGTVNLNKMLRQVLNPPAEHKPELGRMRLGDKVIQTVNSYPRGVFNGDMGQVAAIDRRKETVTVDFAHQEGVAYDKKEISSHLQHAYCLTVHKAQGGEYDAVVFVVSDAHQMLLSRQLVYTAFTRARKMLSVFCDPKILFRVLKGKSSPPTSALAYRIRQLD